MSTSRMIVNYPASLGVQYGPSDAEAIGNWQQNPVELPAGDVVSEPVSCCPWEYQLFWRVGIA